MLSKLCECENVHGAIEEGVMVFVFGSVTGNWAFEGGVPGSGSGVRGKRQEAGGQRAEAPVAAPLDQTRIRVDRSLLPNCILKPLHSPAGRL